MDETGTDVTPSGLEERRARSDLAIAACICLAVASYWIWDHQPVTVTEPQPVSATESQRATSGQFNDQGTRLYQAGDYVGAEAQFRKAINASPNGGLGYCNLGAALIAQKRFDEAIATLQEAIALDPSFPLSRNNLNWALAEKGKHKN